MELSVVIPTLNEASNVAAAVRSAPARAEVLVVDGGSTDDTGAIAQGSGARVLMAPLGRARQMNAGARAARGDVLLFLHADATLPKEAARSIESALLDPGTVGGAFRLRIEPARFPLRVIAFASNLRARYLRFPYGDQGLFVRRDAFEQAGGFPQIPFLEDVAMVRRLRKLGRLAVLDAAVTTGPRHWEGPGPLRTTLLNWEMVALYFAGVPPERLARRYATRRRRVRARWSHLRSRFTRRARLTQTD
jgi:hypothetical protein